MEIVQAKRRNFTQCRERSSASVRRLDGKHQGQHRRTTVLLETARKSPLRSETVDLQAQMPKLDCDRFHRGDSTSELMIYAQQQSQQLLQQQSPLLQQQPAFSLTNPSRVATAMGMRVLGPVRRADNRIEESISNQQRMRKTKTMAIHLSMLPIPGSPEIIG